MYLYHMGPLEGSDICSYIVESLKALALKELSMFISPYLPGTIPRSSPALDCIYNLGEVGLIQRWISDQLVQFINILLMAKHYLEL